MLDTDSVISALRGEGRVGVNIQQRRPSELCISTVTLAELRYGAAQSGAPKLNQLIEQFIGGTEILPFDEECAAQFGIVGVELARRGTKIRALDLLVAAHAMAAEATLVTKNPQNFGQILGLKAESWF